MVTPEPNASNKTGSGADSGSTEPSPETDGSCQDKTGNSCGVLIVITGPSGVGKGTVVERLLDVVPGLVRSVSMTTRTRRQQEAEGVDYLFRSEKEFLHAARSGQLLEWAEFAGAYYGTPAAWVVEELKKGKDVILEIEVKGAKQIQERMPAPVLVFLAPPSFRELEQRLRGRQTETAENIALRLTNARQELKQRHQFQYEVVNDNIESAVENLIHIIYAERLRIRRPPGEHLSS